MELKIKYCPKCNTEKTISEFYVDKHTKDGYASCCKECRALYRNSRREKDKEYRERNKEKLIGCTLEEFVGHLKATYYQNYGVEYDGTRNVHIDHIIPISTAKTEDDVKRLCHWSNLQLLNAEDNLKKSDSLEWGLFCVE